MTGLAASSLPRGADLGLRASLDGFIEGLDPDIQARERFRYRSPAYRKRANPGPNPDRTENLQSSPNLPWRPNIPFAGQCGRKES
jgi:hypothetical protein